MMTMRTFTLSLMCLTLAACGNDGGDTTDGGNGAGGNGAETCEGTAIRFAERLIELESSHQQCASAADCVLFTPLLQCPDLNILLEECPFSIAGESAGDFEVAVEGLAPEFCRQASEGCRASAGCVEVEVVCENGSCGGRYL